METAKLKKFAQTARCRLLNQVGAKLDRVLNSHGAERREAPNAVGELEKQIRQNPKKSVVERVSIYPV